MREDRVFSIPDVESIYTIPHILADQQFDRLIHGKLQIKYENCAKAKVWDTILRAPQESSLTIGLVGKYTALEDSYSSIVEALKHTGHML